MDFLTDFQRKCLQIMADAERDPQSLLLDDEECEYFAKVTSYLKKLLIEKSRLNQYGNAHFAIQLIDEEICRLFMSPVSLPYVNLLQQYGGEAIRSLEVGLGESNESLCEFNDEGDGRVRVSKSVPIPVEEYPTYNFIGRIIGPRGMTAKQLEKDTGCRIMIRGYYSNKRYGYSSKSRRSRGDESESSASSSATSSDSQLRVVVEATGRRKEEVISRVNSAMEVIKGLLIPPPDGRDELKRRQLVELAVMNGTYRPSIPVYPNHFGYSAHSIDN